MSMVRSFLGFKKMLLPSSKKRKEKEKKRKREKRERVKKKERKREKKIHVLNTTTHTFKL